MKLSSNKLIEKIGWATATPEGFMARLWKLLRKIIFFWRKAQNEEEVS